MWVYNHIHRNRICDFNTAQISQEAYIKCFQYHIGINNSPILILVLYLINVIMLLIIILLFLGGKNFTFREKTPRFSKIQVVNKHIFPKLCPLNRLRSKD